MEPSRRTTSPSRGTEASRASLEIVRRGVAAASESGVLCVPAVALLLDESDGSSIVLNRIALSAQLNGLIVATQEILSDSMDRRQRLCVKHRSLV